MRATITITSGQLFEPAPPDVLEAYALLASLCRAMSDDELLGAYAAARRQAPFGHEVLAEVVELKRRGLA